MDTDATEQTFESSQASIRRSIPPGGSPEVLDRQFEEQRLAVGRSGRLVADLADLIALSKIDGFEVRPVIENSSM
jgi:hypothetical protein